MTTATMERPTEAGMEDGWHEVEMETYLAWKRVSASVLKIMDERTPAHVYNALHADVVEDETAARSLGSLAHTAILEPDLLDTVYVVEPPLDGFTKADGTPAKNPRATKDYKEAVAELEETGKTVVSREHWETAMCMRDAVFNNRRTRQLMEAEGPVEVSGAATLMGVPVKVRPDKLIPKLGAHVNLKSTRNAAYAAFQKDVFNFGYYMAAGFYSLVLPALDFDLTRSILLAVETDGECYATAYELDAGTMDAGQEMAQMLLGQIAECYEAEDWPGLPNEITSLSLPHWAWNRVDQALMGEVY